VSESNERWLKSSFSGPGDCVEVSRRPDDIRVRDSKDPQGPVLRFNDHEWIAFTRGVRAGEFDTAVAEDL